MIQCPILKRKILRIILDQKKAVLEKVIPVDYPGKESKRGKNKDGEELLYVNIGDKDIVVFCFQKNEICEKYNIYCYNFDYLNPVIKYLDDLCAKKTFVSPDLTIYTYYGRTGDYAIDLLKDKDYFVVTVHSIFYVKQ